MSDFDQELTRTLHQHAETMPAAPLGFDDVRGKATSIRRRRRLATGLGVAAAIAVIVPTAMFATKGTNAEGPTPATQSPTVIDTNSASPTSTPVMGPDPHALDVRDLPTGAQPDLIYGSTPDGTTAFAGVGDHWVRVINGGVTVSTELSDKVFGPYPTSYGVAVNAAGTAAAWTTDDGDVMAWVDGGDEPATLASLDLQGLRVAAVTGTDCQPAQAGDCRVYVSGSNPTTGESESLAVTFDGGIGDVDPDRRILRVNDADEAGRVLGITTFEADGSCSTVIDGAEAILGPECGYTFDAFSPDGSYVLASEAYHDGVSSGVIAIFTTVGDRLAYRVRTGQEMAGYREAVWEDDTHILFTAYQDGMWSIVRMDVHGAMEYAVPPTKGGDIMDSPFVLQTR